jgi:3-hydroxybutyrate dehydrogenase
MRLKNRVALVTGAASGIGRATAIVLAQLGAELVLCDRAPLDTIRDEVQAMGTTCTMAQGDLTSDPFIAELCADATAAELGGTERRAAGIAMDVTSEEQVEAGMAKAVKTFGRLDILVSNAGIQIVAPLDQFDFKKWKQMLAIYLDGAFLTTRAALRQMYQQDSGGSIIYMGSVHSKEASLLKGPYVTAKHGLVGLAKVVAKEGAKHGVRANVICPGFVRTPLVDKQIPEQAKELGISEAEVIKTIMLKDTVDGEFTTVEDVAEAALFFAAFDSNALTGQSLVVSHGWFMQ